MTDNERSEILDRLRDFAAQQRGAEDLSDRGSLDRAADVVALYEDRGWVAEVDPPKVRRSRGRPVDPESFSRFTKWLSERVPLTGSRWYQLRDAHDLATNYFNGVEIKPKGEYDLRPLKWLTRHDHGDRVSEVWKIACDLAGGKTPDSPTVRRALAQWKRENLPKVERKPGERTARARVNRWIRDAERLMEESPELFIEAVNKVEVTAERYFAREEAAA
jgi:hypothetical protein